MMNTLSTTNLMSKIRTRKEIKKLVAYMSLEDEFSDKTKMAEVKTSFLNRAAGDEKFNNKLKIWLYKNVRISGYEVEEFLGISNYLRRKIIKERLIVPIFTRKYKKGKIRYFSYNDVMHLANSSEFKKLKSDYDLRQANKARREEWYIRL